jgi:hypothetical protein
MSLMRINALTDDTEQVSTYLSTIISLQLFASVFLLRIIVEIISRRFCFLGPLSARLPQRCEGPGRKHGICRPRMSVGQAVHNEMKGAGHTHQAQGFHALVKNK